MSILPTLGLAVCCVACLPAAAEELVIGAQFPLSGPMASYSGPFLRAGAELAEQRINSAQLLGKDRTLKLLIEDNGGDRNQAISLVNRFGTADKVLAIFGVYGGFLSLPAAPVANEVKTPLLTIAVSPAITQAGPWSFTMLALPESQALAIGGYATKRLGIHSIAIVFDRTNEASVRMRDIFQGEMKSHDVNVVSVDGIAPQDTNFAPLATKIASEKIDALYVESVPPVAANFIVQVRQAGLDPKVNILGSTQLSSPTFLDVAGQAANGVYYTSDYVAALPGEENKIFVDAYHKREHKDPDQNAAWAYAGMMILARAINDAGPAVDRDKLREAIGKLRDIPTVLGSGTFSFDQDRLPHYAAVIVQIVNGKPTLAQ
jgi:branched-chain amino acid transport system substrate-binding protein